MNALVLTKKNSLSHKILQEAPLKSHEIRVNVKCVGICGTDKHLYQGQPGSGEANMPVVLGHEISGLIAELGPDVHSALHVGDRVAIDPNIPCGYCRYCKEGRPQLCEHNEAIGVTRHGGMAQFVNVPEGNVYLIPDSLSFQAAAMVEPVSCVVHGLNELTIKSHYTALVVGDGFIGQLFTALLATRVKKVDVSGRNEKKIPILKKIGATEVFNPEIEKHDENYDLVIECVGLPITQERAISSARRGGQVLMFGVSEPEDQIKINSYDIFFKELTIKGAFINPFAMQDAIQLMADRRIDIEALITHELRLEDVPDVLSGRFKEKITKAVVTIG
ncbi:zinc-dependent alcohol dehydrogenase family protein [Sporolactobacillus nakayamae]|uniref:2-desacetyl-2-hydroxyethyl bacteriochlorophyllide A dehydrogenase n=1 Tax=Sporolactobacillus nakayamae TaxID=269670 RepID=A0A1I2NUK4_9BACL|nr:zinc-dependent alcohol dehydrogenase family protein [Sporolactobacillus nakayamae]SFG05297.1 2-desacetyl-2-hydroxyethyl bacteriochlorophyllide A dehydrogenase [Sporolactobacillus nakayamae]